VRYTSRLSLLGLPLVDVVIPLPLAPGAPPEKPVARGWLAFGPIAVGVVAFGGLAVGGFAFGGLACALLSIGGLSLGGIAFGGGAVGVWAAGGGAIALEGALGGLAIAGEYALGGAAFAPHANDAVAREYFRTGPADAFRHVAANSGWLVFLVLLPLLAWLFARKRARGGDDFTPR
jgi:hypothetical protein